MEHRIAFLLHIKPFDPREPAPISTIAVLAIVLTAIALLLSK
jgi:hypothetical protein